MTQIPHAMRQTPSPSTRRIIRRLRGSSPDLRPVARVSGHELHDLPVRLDVAVRRRRVQLLIGVAVRLDGRKMCRRTTVTIRCNAQVVRIRLLLVRRRQQEQARVATLDAGEVTVHDAGCAHVAGTA
jgi:hypothetical protein